MGYSTLKAALDAVVRTNGRQEITGANLNGVMTTILQGVDILDRANPADTSGMNKVVLDKSKTFAEQVTGTNTIYEIRDNYDLIGNSVSVPAGCILNFMGGKVSNGTLVFNNTRLIGSPKILTSVSGTILGTADITWFVSDADLSNDIAPGITKASLVSKSIIIPTGTYYIKTAADIDCTDGKTIVWDGDLVYDGSLSVSDIITIKGGGFNLTMGGTFKTTSVSHVSANKFDIVAICIRNCYRSFCVIGEIQGFNVGIKILGSGAGCVNNTINLSRIRDCNIGILLTQQNEGGQQGWANENLIMGGRIMISSSWDSNNFATYVYAGTIPGSTDSYNKINGLSFYKLNLEGEVATHAFHLENCQRSDIVDFRNEGNRDVKLVGECALLRIVSIYNQPTFDLSEITKRTPAPLFRDLPFDSVSLFQQKISFAKTNGVVQGTRFYSESEIHHLLLNSQTLNYSNSSADIVNSAQELDFATLLQFTKATGFKAIVLNLTNQSGARKYMYFKITEVDGETSFAQADYMYSFTSPMSYYSTGDRYNSGADLSSCCILIFHPKVKKVVFGFKAVSDVDIVSTADFTFLKNTKAHSGTTAERPTYVFTGFVYYDTDLGKPITWNGTAWVNMDGSALS